MYQSEIKRFEFEIEFSIQYSEFPNCLWSLSAEYTLKKGCVSKKPLSYTHGMPYELPPFG